jgi:hypothetical protein
MRKLIKGDTDMRRITKAMLLAGPAIALLAACSSGGTTASPPPATTPASTPATTSLGASPSSSPTPAKSLSTTRCHTADLTVATAADQGGGAAGSFGEYLVFTNKSGHSCTLYGYPGVSFVAGDNGTQVNVPFTRTGGTKSTVRVKAGGKAYSLIILVQYLNYPTADCKPVAIRGYRVYPPDETAAVFVSAPQKVCSVKNKGVGQVQPIVAKATA